MDTTIKLDEKSQIEMLAIEGHGALEVDEAKDKAPPIVFLAGPIKHWWKNWGTPMHKEYTTWRAAVETALVKAGIAVYMPHKAIRGRWNEKLQQINNAGIAVCDVLIYMTPDGVPADGTADEVTLAACHRKHIIYAPPGDERDIKNLIGIVKKVTELN